MKKMLVAKSIVIKIIPIPWMSIEKKLSMNFQWMNG
jgi:hypothetical protein